MSEKSDKNNYKKSSTASDITTEHTNIGHDSTTNIFYNATVYNIISEYGVSLKEVTDTVRIKKHNKRSLSKEKKVWKKYDGTFSKSENKEFIEKSIDIATPSENEIGLLSKVSTLRKYLRRDDDGLLFAAIKRVAMEDEIDKFELHADDDFDSFLSIYQKYSEYTTKVEETYDSRYRRIYNLLRSSDILSFIIPKIKEIESKTNDKKEISRKFYDLWYGRLKYHPTNIYVGYPYKEDDIISEISQRFLNKNQEKVVIFSRKERTIAISKKACNNYTSEHTNISLKISFYKIAKDPAAKFILAKKKKN